MGNGPGTHLLRIPGPFPISHFPFPQFGMFLAHESAMDQPVQDLPETFPSDPRVVEVPPDNPDRRLRRGVANRAFRAIKMQRAAQRSWIEAVADGLNTIASSAPFLALHAVWFVVWIG